MAPKIARESVWRVRRWTALGGCLLVAIGVVAMALTNEEPDPAGVALYDAADSSGVDALLEGTLSLSDGCVTISAQGAEWTPVFPRGSVERSGDILTWGGTDYRTSSRIAVGGGETPASEEFTIPAGCSQDHLWLVSPR